MATKNSTKLASIGTECNGKATVSSFDIEGQKHMAFDDLETIAALADAIKVLTALERSPTHQDSHPSHDIKTGGGYANNHRLHGPTLPKLASHVSYLAFDLQNRLDCFFGELESGGANV